MRESKFEGLSVNHFIEIPTEDVNNTRRFRINTKTEALEHYSKGKWISHSFIDLSYENGLAEVLPIAHNFLYDTKNFDGITSSSSELLGSHKHTWCGRSTIDFKADSIVETLPYYSAIKAWKLSDIKEVDSKIKSNSKILRLKIRNNSNATCRFLQQQNISSLGSTQVRSYVFVKSENDKTYLTDTYKLNKNVKWEYLTLKNHKWNPKILPKGYIECFIYLPYFSTGWHGNDYIAWNDGGTTSNNDNITLKNKYNNVVIANNFDEVINCGLPIPKNQLGNLKTYYVDELYKHVIKTIQDYHVEDFIKHDLVLNQFNESIKFDLDRNVHVDTKLKYPFLLHHSKEYSQKLLNLPNKIKHKMCIYRDISRELFLQYDYSKNSINSAITLKELKTEFNVQKKLITNKAKDINDTYTIS